MKSKGFTLTEMLVVLAIIGILAGISYPIVASLVGKSREAACLNNLRSLGTALQGYLDDHNQMMPTLEVGRASKTEDLPVLDVVLMPYLESSDGFACPADKSVHERTGTSYAWNNTQNGLHVTKLSFFTTQQSEKIPLIIDKESWHPSGTNFLYADLSSSNRVRFVANP